MRWRWLALLAFRAVPVAAQSAPVSDAMVQVVETTADRPSTPDAPSTADPPSRTDAPRTADPPSTTDAPTADDSLDLLEVFESTVTWRLFGDAAFRVSDHATAVTDFVTGSVDLFVSGDLGENVRALSESVLEVHDGGPTFDLERVYLEWAPFSFLRFRLGRDHLFVGHYMQAYHHALFFQLATARPRLVAFEDDGGLLPAHLIGLEVLGDVGIADVTFGYALTIGNGRGPLAADVLTRMDDNPFKALALRLTCAWDLGLTIGVSAYVDQVPPGPADPRGVWEYLANAYVVYDAHPFDVIAEGYFVRHVSSQTGVTSDLISGFTQVGVTPIDLLTAFVRAEYVDRGADRFYDVSGAPRRVMDLRAGLRITLVEQAILKLEYRHEFALDLNEGTVQVAFAL